MTVTTNGKTNCNTNYKDATTKEVALARHVALVALVTIYHLPPITYHYRHHYHKQLPEYTRITTYHYLLSPTQYRTTCFNLTTLHTSRRLIFLFVKGTKADAQTLVRLAWTPSQSGTHPVRLYKKAHTKQFLWGRLCRTFTFYGVSPTELSALLDKLLCVRVSCIPCP